MMMARLNYTLIIIALQIVFHCEFSYGNHESYQNTKTQRKSEDYLKNTNVIKEGLESFTADILGKLFKESGKNKNLVISPISIYSALAMVGKGAKNKTYKEIKDAMNLPNIVSYPMVLFSRQTFKSKSLKFAQRVFVDKTAKISPNYQNLMYLFGIPKAMNIDFKNEPEKSTEYINNWISENTNGKIKDLIQKGVINKNTELIIANALALKASWIKEFNEPRLGRFEISPNNFNDVMMMKSSIGSPTFCKSTSFRGVTNYMTSAQIVTMPFKDNSLIFAMAIPNTAGDFSELDTKTGYKKMFDTVDRMHPISDAHSNWFVARSFERCTVKMPVFDIDFTYEDFKDHLKALGIRSAFESDKANFSGILDSVASRNNVYVSDVIHKATFNLNKKGVEATAATAFFIGSRMITPSKDVTIDKPFVFLVKNVETGAVLFIGRVVRP